MEETVEEVLEYVMKRIETYDYSDQHWLYTEIAEALRREADCALRMGSFDNPDD